MTQQLNKMKEVAAKVKAKGGDTNLFEQRIKTAEAAVAAQAGKSYVITITTEKNLKIDVGKVRSTLEADLKEVHTRVVRPEMYWQTQFAN